MKRILVVGGGLIGSRHVQIVQAHKGCELVGLVDPNPTLDVDPSVPLFTDMADVPDPADGVIVATPTALHAEHGAYAAKRGWHMLIEKPVAGDLAQANALQQAIKDTGVRSLVGHHRRYHQRVDTLRTLLKSGAVGEVVTISMIWAMRKPDSYFEENWRTVGGSPVMINLVHDIDLLRHLIGEIAGSVALGGSRTRGAERIESGAIALSFETGATGTISFADTAPSPWGFEAATNENPNIGTTAQDMMWITGTKGGVSFPSLTHWSGAADWSQPARPHVIEPTPGEKPPLVRQLDHFIDVMNDKAHPLIDVEDATKTLAAALHIDAQLTQATT